MNSKQLECSGYPLTVGSVHGIRQWKVDRYGRLSGITYTQIWRPGENVAECRRNEDVGMFTWNFGGSTAFVSNWLYAAGDPAPRKPSPPPKPAEPQPCDGLDPDCTCGFYAYHDGVADYAAKAPNVVAGIIEGYGKTTVGTRGFRCEKAKIVALTVKPDGKGRRSPSGDLARRIARNYPDAVVFSSKREMCEQFPPDRSLEPTPETDPEFWERKL